MKKVLLVLSLLALMLTAEDINRLVRLTVISKSSMPVELSLTGSDEEHMYYLRIPRADPDAPILKTFTIIPDTYQATAYYVEPWDPVYGYKCSSKGGTLNAMSNIKVIILECNRVVKHPGDPGKVKLGVGGGRARPR